MHLATRTHNTTPGLWMAIACPTCNGPVHTTNPGATNGREAKTIVRCPEHGHGEWLITCRITPMIERVGYQGPES
jgi:hypothetical protein